MAPQVAVNVLLDTCALLALSRGDLPDSAASALASAPEAYVSTVTAWEVAIKVNAGKLRLKVPPLQWFSALIERHALREVHLDARTVCAAASLPAIHRDPFDRVLGALAQARELVVLTSDEHIPKYVNLRSIW